MLRLLDVRSRAYVEIEPARVGILPVCAHAPQTAQGADLTGLRVLLVADLLVRAAELRHLQVLVVVAFAGQVPGQLTDFEQAAGALGTHSPQARAFARRARADDANAAPPPLGGVPLRLSRWIRLTRSVVTAMRASQK
jgi:hypothetical protein